MELSNCIELLKQRDNFLIISHSNPDGDTLGSGTALCSALRRIGKTAYIFPNQGITDKYMPYVQVYFPPEGYSADTVAAVDVAATGLFPKGFEGKVDICIDHHPSNEHYADFTLLRCDSSCGELMLDVVSGLCGSVTKEEADLLYIALSTDTGCFQYSNTNAHSFSTAARLLELGADYSVINTVFFRKMSVGRLKLEGMVYSGIKLFRDGTISVATITRKMLEDAGARENDLDDLAGLAGRVQGSLVSVTIREQEGGKCKISVRSPKEIDSCAICAIYGGGGHKMAAGCTLTADPDTACDMIISAINEVWK